MKLSELIVNYRKEHSLSQRQLAAQCSLSTGYISLIEKETNPQTGKRMIPTLNVLNKLAKGMGRTIDELLAACDDMPVDISDADTPNKSTYTNILPITTKRFPMLGEIACGKPIFANEEKELYIEAGADIKADFCLIARGDSMIGARINDGDIVFIRSQPTVENNEIAAVVIDDEATLKRVYYDPENGILLLMAENPQYQPLRYIGEELDHVHILGKAVAFQSDVR